MASFSSKLFGYSRYAVARPSYPFKLYDKILSYQSGPRDLAVDLGTGHGTVAITLSHDFDSVVGVDPSAGMIAQAQRLLASDLDPSSAVSIRFQQGSAESLSFCEDESVDLITAAECAHWFDYDKFWPEAARVVRPGGTIAIWGYMYFEPVDFPKATPVMNSYANDLEEHLLGSFWPQPGHRILLGHMREIVPPGEEWHDVKRIEYHPGKQGVRSGEGEVLMERTMKVGSMMEFMRTSSAYHKWLERWPDRKRRQIVGNKDEGPGDVIDEMLDEMVKAEPAMAQKAESEGVTLGDLEVNVEWGTAIILARKR